ncbi:hypothetical protein AVEN_142902-1 [Araneus ventricosus]|uniref:TIL domain-containing protein n=1 Tax=Araneus ventricosus TaxID=182803 RepID=A0A4Y2FN60_ARAVE|nr:hypothetical protein AVEN_142902-1 [Araneus ventricosus]
MAGRNVLFACCVLIFSGIQFSYGQFNLCGRFETEADCADFCNTCEPKPCDMSCIPGCSCIPGFARDSSGRCIPQEFCNRDASIQGRGLSLGVSGCPNERLCVMNCKRRNFRDGICLGPGREFCNCFTVSNRPL